MVLDAVVKMKDSAMFLLLSRSSLRKFPIRSCQRDRKLRGFFFFFFFLRGTDIKMYFIAVCLHGQREGDADAEKNC